EHDDVEGDDVPVAGEAEEVVVLGLGVGAAELVAGGQQRHRSHGATGRTGRQVADAPQQHHRGEGVGDVVDDVVQQGPVESGDDLLDHGPEGQEPVVAVDDHRDQEQPEHRGDLTGVGEVDHEQGQDHSDGGVQVHRPGDDTP